VPARSAHKLHLPAAKSFAATTTHAVIVQRFPSVATIQAAQPAQFIFGFHLDRAFGLHVLACLVVG